MPNLDLYTITAGLIGLLFGSILGWWMARLVFSHTAARLERKVQTLADSKFKLKGQKVRLKQLEQRLDAEAAAVPQAEQDLTDKAQEIQELTTALSETTSLAQDLSSELRQRRSRAEHLESEVQRWETRNKALRMKIDAADERIAEANAALTAQRDENAQLTGIDTIEAAAPELADATAPDTPDAAGPAAPAAAPATAPSEPLQQIASRLARMENELGVWLDKVGELEDNANRGQAQNNGLSKLSEVLRGEARKHRTSDNPEGPAEDLLKGGSDAA